MRPIQHHLGERVRAHIFLCMLAYYVEWHMREAWRPLLFADDELAEQRRTRDPVALARPSDSAKLQKATRQAQDGTPLHSFPTLMQSLANVCRATGQAGSGTAEFEVDADLSDEQERGMELLKEIQI